MYGRAGLDRFKKAQSLEPFSVTNNVALKPIGADVAPSAVPGSASDSAGRGQSTWLPPDWAIEPRPGVYYLEVLKDGEVLDRINLDKRRNIFGRQFASCDFVLDHQSVSRQHAAVIPHKNGSLHVYCWLFNVKFFTSEDEWVFDAWEEGGEVGRWNPLFPRHFNDWEMKEVEGLFWKLHHLVLNRDVEDVLSSKNSKNGSFSIRSLYGSFSRASSDPFPWSMIWRSWPLMRVSFFTWEASWNRILTIDQLKRRAGICRIVGPALLNQKEFDGWHGAFVSKRKDKAWRAAPFCLIIYVIDLGSAHGTFVANERLTKETPVELEVGQSLRFAASTRSYILRKNNEALFPPPPLPSEVNLPPPPDPSDEEAVLAYNTTLNRYGLSKSDLLPKSIESSCSSDGVDVETEPGPVGVKEGSLVGKYESLVQITVIPKGKEQPSVREDNVSQKGVTDKLQEVLNKVKTAPKSGIYDDLYGESFSGKLGSSWAYSILQFRCSVDDDDDDDVDDDLFGD
ncbi:Protein phosphatase 1 regulatory inhibitor subunit PPP1R8-like [Vitis vinifera]|uniref:Protein phosphatase 1 regulatory inhibitor subunit PPP1R8-like n=1 Tax=Vitis vinifera TaxID=29760 RepID=A0A438D422_VITVI|nr:Protein phosphatase 1 regulatory inhibitor subunit PPP1R8-like [Vitis vinifera]